MSLLLPLLQQLRALLERPGAPDLVSVVSTLDLDMSIATVTQTRGNFVILDARRRAYPLAPGIAVCTTGPKRMIFLTLEGLDRITYTQDMMAGLAASIESSKRGDGFASTAPLGTAKVGCTVSNTDQRIETIFCEVQIFPER